MISFHPIQTNEEIAFLNEVRNECAKEFLHNSETYTLEETIKWYSTLRTPYYLVTNNSEKIGYFRTSNYSKINENMYVGMDIHNSHRGKGLAFESYKLFIPYIFYTFFLHKVSLEVLVTNKRAISLYHKLGFFAEGVKREEVFKNGIYVDSLIMSLLKHDMKSNSIYT
jgi:RimJ/RimL family protein N-acetyltransferase